MNPLIDQIYQTRRVKGRSGKVHEVHSNIDVKEGRFLHDLIAQDSTILHTLEVGCAFGLSSLHICHALSTRPGARHTIIDPKQSTVWDGAGMENLKASGHDFIELIEKPSEIALPELLATGATYDFVFVDGWHTFDHALLDCFYGTRLLRTGGYLVLDDADWPSVRRVVDYLTHYPCYREHASLQKESARKEPARPKKRSLLRRAVSVVPGRVRNRLFHPSLVRETPERGSADMVAFQKQAADDRRWDWFPKGFLVPVFAAPSLANAVAMI